MTSNDSLPCPGCSQDDQFVVTARRPVREWVDGVSAKDGIVASDSVTPDIDYSADAGLILSCAHCEWETTGTDTDAIIKALQSPNASDPEQHVWTVLYLSPRNPAKLFSDTVRIPDSGSLTDDAQRAIRRIRSATHMLHGMGGDRYVMLGAFVGGGPVLPPTNPSTAPADNLMNTTQPARPTTPTQKGPSR